MQNNQLKTYTALNVQKRIHSINDLFLSLIAAASIALTITLSFYAHHTVVGFASDFRAFAPTVMLYLQVPVYVLVALLQYILPLIVVIRLVYHKEYYYLLSAFGVYLLTYFAVYFSNQLLGIYADNLIMETLYQGAVGKILSLPVEIATLAAVLSIIGPRSRDRIFSHLWQALFAITVFMVITSLSTVAGAVFCFQVGLFVGLLGRFAIGRESKRAVGKALLKAIDSCGFNAVRVENITPTATTNKRIYKAFNSSGDTRHVAVFDSDRQALGWLNSLGQFLRQKDAQFRSQSFASFFEHISLMNYAVESAGANHPKLLASTIQGESAVFLFEDSEVVRPLTRKNAPTVSIDDFWKELHRTHRAGFTWRVITPSKLRIRGDKPTIWEPESGEIASTELHRRIDEAQLLVNLSLYYGKTAAVESFMRYVELEKMSEAAEVLASVLSLCEKMAMPSAIKRLPKIKERLLGIRIRLQDVLDSLEVSENAAEIEALQEEKIEIRRIPPKKAFGTGLTVVAVMLVLTQLNFDAVISALESSNHFWALAAFLFGGLTYLGGGVVLQAFARDRVPLKEAVSVQVAASILMLQLPSGVGPFTLNLQYLNKRSRRVSGVVRVDSKQLQGQISRNSATATCVQLAQILGTFALVFLFSLVAGRQVLKPNQDGNIGLVLLIATVLVAIILTIPKSRKLILSKAAPFLRQFSGEFAFIITQPRRVVWGLLGVLIQAAGFCLSFWACLMAFGLNLDFFAVCLVFLVGNSAGSLSPTPGGLGVVEAALSTLTVALGAGPSVALSAILLFRLVTLWLRAPLGAIMRKHLVKTGVL